MQDSDTIYAIIRKFDKDCVSEKCCRRKKRDRETKKSGGGGQVQIIKFYENDSTLKIPRAVPNE